MKKIESISNVWRCISGWMCSRSPCRRGWVSAYEGAGGCEAGFWAGTHCWATRATNFAGKQKPSQKDHLRNPLPSQHAYSEQANSHYPVKCIRASHLGENLFRGHRKSLGGNAAPSDPPMSLIMVDGSPKALEILWLSGTLNFHSQIKVRKKSIRLMPVVAKGSVNLHLLKGFAVWRQIKRTTETPKNLFI